MTKVALIQHADCNSGYIQQLVRDGSHARHLRGADGSHTSIKVAAVPTRSCQDVPGMAWMFQCCGGCQKRQISLGLCNVWLIDEHRGPTEACSKGLRAEMLLGTTRANAVAIKVCSTEVCSKPHHIYVPTGPQGNRGHNSAIDDSAQASDPPLDGTVSILKLFFLFLL